MDPPNILGFLIPFGIPILQHGKRFVTLFRHLGVYTICRRGLSFTVRLMDSNRNHAGWYHSDIHGACGQYNVTWGVLSLDHIGDPVIYLLIVKSLEQII